MDDDDDDDLTGLKFRTSKIFGLQNILVFWYFGKAKHLTSAFVYLCKKYINMLYAIFCANE